MSWGFVEGQTYVRARDIHGNFGGQPRPGIITPSNHAVIFLISGTSGLKHGYKDEWRPDGVFEYFGMGREGHMKMASGNRAIRDHSKDGKSLLLFETLPKRRLRFAGEMVCEAVREVQATDTKGDMRSAFVFELRRLSAIVQSVSDEAVDASAGLAKLRERAIAASRAVVEGKATTANSFARSRAVRDYVLARAAGHCEWCRKRAPFRAIGGLPYLEPHHVHRLSDGGPDDPRFVIALCPNCHRRAHFGSYRENLSRRHLRRVEERMRL